MWCLVVSNAAASLLYSKINLSMLEPIGFSPDICKTQNIRKQIRRLQLRSIRVDNMGRKSIKSRQVSFSFFLFTTFFLGGEGGGGELSSASSGGCLDGPAVGRTVGAPRHPRLETGPRGKVTRSHQFYKCLVYHISTWPKQNNYINKTETKYLE